MMAKKELIEDQEVVDLFDDPQNNKDLYPERLLLASG